MKKLPPFLAGMLTMALIVGLGVSALAATGQLTLTVDPVNIQVNGSTFAPKDAKGNDVPVFAYNGTTYAPLRALAEAYGLTVGYDGAARMATVSSTPAAPETTPADYSDWSAEDEAAYQEFKGLWEVSNIGGGTNERGETGATYGAHYTGEMTDDELMEFINSNALKAEFCERLLLEFRKGEDYTYVVFYSRESGIGTTSIDKNGKFLITF